LNTLAWNKEHGTRPNGMLCQESTFLIFALARSLIEANYGHHDTTVLQLRNHAFLCGLFIAKSITTFSEHLVKVILKPPDIWAESGKLPHPIDLLVPVGVGAVGMALDCDRL